jgi:hypothetical protein
MLPAALFELIKVILTLGPVGAIALVLVISAFSEDLLPKLIPDFFIDLKEVATKINGDLERFLKDLEKTGKKRINFLTTDHFQTSSAVRIAKQRSLEAPASRSTSH